MNAGAIDRRAALKLAASAATVLPLGFEVAPVLAAGKADRGFGLGRAQAFDLDWRFMRGTGDGREAAAFDDNAWRKVDLPHDWSIEDLPAGDGVVGPFDKHAIGGTAQGFTLGGEGWYRKRFRLAALPKAARVEIEFDGIFMISDVWLNGTHLGSHVHGYTPFAYDLTAHINRDGGNVIAIRVRNIGKTSRWYPGSGLYRQVKLNVLPTEARIAKWGVGAWTRRIADGRAEVDVTTTLENADGLTITTRLRNTAGHIIAEATGPADTETKQTLHIPAPALWSPETPYLYTLESVLHRGAQPLDTVTQHFGIRIVTMDAERGLRINGKRHFLRGGCIHHDNGLLGSCAFADADERRVRLLQARGYTAIRSSHNPASATLRAACDKLGMLMMYEAFDVWTVPKVNDDYANYFKENWKEALAAMVLSARNSPSIIMWSIGNEIAERSRPEGVEWSWKLSNEVRRLDPTRPVTEALNGVLGPLMFASEAAARPGRAGEAEEASTIFLDVAGYNYRLEDIEGEQTKHPKRIVVATETFPKDVYDYQVLMNRAPYFLGEFVWTAMDYIGEAGVGSVKRVSAKSAGFSLEWWPWVISWCGDIDLIGQQKAPSLARDVVWGRSALEILVQRPIPEGQKEVIAPWGWRDELPSWTWPDAMGKPMAVRLYSSGDAVALLLNGKEIGHKALAAADKQIAEFSVPYTPGTLEAVAYRGGKEVGRKRLITVGVPVKLRLTPERPSGHSGRQALSYVALEVLDAQGRLVPEAEYKVRLTVHGPAELVGFGSANPKAVGSFQSPEAQTFRGRALAILRDTGAKGAVRIEARTQGLRGDVATIRSV